MERPSTEVDPKADSEAGDDGYTRFLVVSCTIDRLDWLMLGTDGHRRARWAWQDDAWHGAWVAP